MNRVRNHRPSNYKLNPESYILNPALANSTGDGVDLCALQLAGIIDVNGFPFREDVEHLRAAFAVAVAGRLRAAERQMDFGADGRRVDVEDAGLHVFQGAKSAVRVARVDRRRQAVADAVSNLNRVIEVAAFDHRHDRAKDLFLLDAHPRLHACENRRLDEVTILEIATLGAMAAGEQLGFVFALADVDVAQNLFKRLLIDHRADLRLIAQAVAQTQRLRAIDQQLCELLGHLLVNDDARGGGATLAGRTERAPQHVFDREIEVGVFHDHDDVLAAH